MLKRILFAMIVGLSLVASAQTGTAASVCVDLSKTEFNELMKKNGGIVTALDPVMVKAYEQAAREITGQEPPALADTGDVGTHVAAEPNGVVVEIDPVIVVGYDEAGCIVWAHFLTWDQYRSMLIKMIQVLNRAADNGGMAPR